MNLEYVPIILIGRQQKTTPTQHYYWLSRTTSSEFSFLWLCFISDQKHLTAISHIHQSIVWERDYDTIKDCFISLVFSFFYLSYMLRSWEKKGWSVAVLKPTTLSYSWLWIWKKPWDFVTLPLEILDKAKLQFHKHVLHCCLKIPRSKAKNQAPMQIPHELFLIPWNSTPFLMNPWNFDILFLE